MPHTLETIRRIVREFRQTRRAGLKAAGIVGGSYSQTILMDSKTILKLAEEAHTALPAHLLTNRAGVAVSSYRVENSEPYSCEKSLLRLMPCSLQVNKRSVF